MKKVNSNFFAKITLVNIIQELFFKLINMKKIFSILVLVSISFSWVFAFSDAENIRAANYLAKKTFIKDFTVKPENYRVDDNITRKEAMKIISNVAYLKVENECTWKYKDVIDDWGCKYIEAALKAWFVNPWEKFRPDDNITKAEVMKLLFKARNLDKKVNTWIWQEDYMNTAFSLWLLDAKEVEYNLEAKRWWIFVVIARTFTDYINDKNFILYSDEVKIK